MPAGDAFLQFQRAKFKTRLPLDQLYTAGHMWLRNAQGNTWQVGLTRFALRMLGDPVELDFELQPGDPVETGQVVGWLEGFKAVSDLYSPMAGHFGGGNPLLDGDIEALGNPPADRGWIFALQGSPSDECLDAEGYAAFLTSTVDRMLGQDSMSKQDDGGLNQ